MQTCAPELTVPRVDELNFVVLEQVTQTVEHVTSDGTLPAVGGALDDGQSATDSPFSLRNLSWAWFHVLLTASNRQGAGEDFVSNCAY